MTTSERIVKLTEIEQFIEDLASSANEITASRSQIKIYKASVRFAIAFAVRKHAGRTALSKVKVDSEKTAQSGNRK